MGVGCDDQVFDELIKLIRVLNAGNYRLSVWEQLREAQALDVEDGLLQAKNFTLDLAFGFAAFNPFNHKGVVINEFVVAVLHKKCLLDFLFVLICHSFGPLHNPVEAEQVVSQLLAGIDLSHLLQCLFEQVCFCSLHRW